ncbi:ribonuclease P protein component [Winogradskyella sp. A3E31]|uniref:ribonuclease P protein component n=1 Tax=Winogradskyella sp. A3E31 TaxID=3349637 RepID=UPI00398B8751
MSFTYSKKEKLKSKKLIEQLFNEGKSVSAFPLRLVYFKTSFEDNVSFKTGVSVSKKRFKKAVDRNRIKRLLREAYRLNKPKINNSETQFAFMILYLGKEMPSFDDINDKTQLLFKKFEEKAN